MTKLTLSLTFIFLTQFLFAQQPCGTHDYESYLNAKFPGFNEAINSSRQESSNAVNRLNKVGKNDTVYRVPIVFHIVWNTQTQNIHDSLVYSQMKALNESYRHNHKDTANIRNAFKPLAGDTKIEFYLADRDPSGNPTNGINRVKTTRTDFNDGMSTQGEDVKFASSGGVDAWNPEKYLNIWVCKFTLNGNVAVAAYAFPPVNAKNWNSIYFKSLELQGVVTNYQYVGVKNPNDKSSNSIRERTLVHEVGHYLGLRHVWADKTSCTGEDDGIKDTPLCRSATTNCSTIKNTCTEPNDKPDMTENYMDYTPYPCTVMFTRDQVELMRYNLLNLRSKLYKLKVTIAPALPNDNITVSPNPVKGDMKLLFVEKGTYNLFLVDIIGQSVANEEIKVGDSYDYNFNTGNLRPGFYYLNITQSNNVVLKQRILVE